MWNCSSYFSPWTLATCPMFLVILELCIMFCFQPRKNTGNTQISGGLSLCQSFPEFYPAASFHLSFLSSELLTSAGPLGSLGSPSLHLQSLNCLQDVHSTHLLCFPSSGGQSYRPLVQCLKTAVSCVLFSFLIVHSESEVFVAFNQAGILVKRGKKKQ